MAHRIRGRGTERVSVKRVESPWMSAIETADYMRCPLSRVRKLTMTRELPHCKDGRRVLYHREEVDMFIRNGGAVSP